MSIFQKILFGDLEKFSDEFDTEKNDYLGLIRMGHLWWLGQGLKSQSGGTCWPKHPVQNEDHSGNAIRCAPGSPCCNSEKWLERFRIEPEIVSSTKNRAVSTATQITTLCPFELLKQLPSHSPFNFFWDSCKVVLTYSRKIYVPWQIVTKIFISAVPVNCFLSLFFLILPFVKG